MLVLSFTKITATGMTATTPATKRMSELPTALPITTASSNPSSSAVQTTIWFEEIFRRFIQAYFGKCSLETAFHETSSFRKASAAS
jgi:hypothetical protein